MTDLLKVTRDQLRAITTDSRIIRQLEKLFEAAFYAASFTTRSTIDLLDDITADTTITATQRFVTLDATAASLVITLPPLASARGFMYSFRRVNTSVAHTCLASPDGAEEVRLTIGATVGILPIGWPSPYESLQLFAGKDYWELVTYAN